MKWAQSASEVFITALSNPNVKRFSNQEISKVSAYLSVAGEGIYLVGLDQHVGFITYRDEEMYFVHANYYQPNIGVMKEELDSKNPLSDSNYRIIGKLFSKKMVINWLQETKYF